MKRLFLSASILLSCAAYGQEVVDDTVRSVPKWQHFVGVQANGLIQQILNFNNAAATIANPYLLTYHMNSLATGYGIRAGLGYNYKNNTNTTTTTTTESDINEIDARLGLEKVFCLSHNWSAGVGVDGIMNYNSDKTLNINRSFDTTTTKTNSLSKSFGGGVMGWLRYRLTEKIWVGTESSFYYMTGKENKTIENTRKQIGQGNPIVTTVTKSEPTFSEAKFSMPVVFYLLVRF